jgi:hypothetical protein
VGGVLILILFLFFIISVLFAVILFVFFVGSFASALVAVGASIAVVAFEALEFLGRELVAVAGESDGFDWIAGGRSGGGGGEFRGDLKTIDETAGVGSVDAAGGESADDLGESHLDGTAILEDGQFEFGFRGRSLAEESAVDAVMLIAIGQVFEGGCLTARTVGQDMTTFHVHEKNLLSACVNSAGSG